MKTKFSLSISILLVIFLLLGCTKEKEDIINPYFSNGYIKFTCQVYNFNYNIDISDIYTVYTEYEKSSIRSYHNVLNNEEYKRITIARSSKDFKNEILLEFYLDSLNNYIPTYNDQSYYNYTFITNEYQLVNRRLDLCMSCRKITELSFNEEKKTISGKFSYNVDNYFNIEGEFSSQLYDFIQ